MEYSKYFKTIELKDGGKRVVCTDDAPENLRDMIRGIHFNFFNECLPNDWIYKIIEDAFYEIETDGETAIENIEADTYDYDLAKWFSQNLVFTKDICNEAMDEVNIDCGIVDIVSAGQYRAKMVIYQAVLSFIQERGE